MKELALSIGGYDIPVPKAVVPATNLANNFGEVILRVAIEVMLFIVVILAIIFMVWAGLQWILSGGDKARLEGARNRLIYSIIGLILAFSAFLIINFIGTIFNVTLLR